MWASKRSAQAESDAATAGTVMKPVLYEDDADICMACGEHFSFSSDDNAEVSVLGCLYHEHDNGMQGKYCRVISRNSTSTKKAMRRRRSNASNYDGAVMYSFIPFDCSKMLFFPAGHFKASVSGPQVAKDIMQACDDEDNPTTARDKDECFEWSCCGSPDQNNKGCKKRPHQFKVMIAVSADTNPPTRVENVEVSVIHHLEISIFPSAAYDLQLAITNRVVDMMHEYFSIDNFDYDALANGTTGAQGAGMGMHGEDGEGVGEISKRSQSPATRRQSASGKGPNDAQKRGTVVVHSKESKDSSRQAAAENARVTPSRRQECLYLRYFRVGNINLDLTTKGFTLNVNNFKLVMEAFVHRGTLCSWRDLVWNLEKHVLLSFSRHTVRNLWPWSKGQNGHPLVKAAGKGGGLGLGGDSKLPPIPSSSSSPSKSSVGRAPGLGIGIAGSTDGDSFDEEAKEVQDKLSALLGLRLSENFSSSPKKPARFGYLVELKRKFDILRKK